MPYHAWDPNKAAENTDLSNNNLTVARDTGTMGSAGSVGGDYALDPTKKIYFEVEMVDAADSVGDVGIVTEDFVFTNGLVSWNYEAWGYDNMYDRKCHRPTQTAYGDPTGMTDGDVVGVAVDMPNGDIWFRFNGTWKASGADPANGTNPDFTGQDFLTKAMYIAATLATGQDSSPASFTLRTDPNDWDDAAPTGFVAAEEVLPTYNGALDDAYHAQRLSAIPRNTVIQTAPTRGAAALSAPMARLTAYGAGQAALTAPFPRIAGTGLAGTGGLAALRAPMAALSAAGYQSLTGQAALTAPLAITAGRGLVGTSGQAALTAPLAFLAGTGLVAPRGPGGVTAPMARMWAMAQIQNRFADYRLEHRR